MLDEFLLWSLADICLYGRGASRCNGCGQSNSSFARGCKQTTEALQHSNKGLLRFSRANVRRSGQDMVSCVCCGLACPVAFWWVWESPTLLPCMGPKYTELRVWNLSQCLWCQVQIRIFVNFPVSSGSAGFGSF